MNSVQESKQELEAAIRYSENAISKAKQTIESLATHQEQTGREEALTKQVQELEREVQRQQGLGQGYYDSMMTFKAEVDKLRSEKEASSGPCGCQAYRDLEERATMPVIPKDVAIAIFREGMAYGACRVCDELDNATDIKIEESGYTGGFEVSFCEYIDLSDHLDLDYLRESTSVYDESSVIDALYTLCADNEFECRIHGIDDQEEKKNEG